MKRYKVTDKLKLWIIGVLLTVMLLPALAGTTPAMSAFAVVVDTDNDFDHTKIEDDLSDEDLTLFLPNPLGEPEIFEFVEYCYSDSLLKQDNYALYVYVFNPQKTEYTTRDGANRITMGKAYDRSDPNNIDDRITWEPFGLRFCDCTDDRLFYKFRVIDAATVLPEQRANQNAWGHRRYDVAELQLWEIGKQNAISTGVGGTWEYTGYARGYDNTDNADSTLECTKKRDRNYLTLDLHETFYRPEWYNNDKFYGEKDQVNAVYFTVPDRYFDKYGEIYSIDMDWYEYKTQPIAVVTDQELYSGLYPYIGKDISRLYTDSNGWASSTINYGMCAEMIPMDGDQGSIWLPWEFWSDVASMSAGFVYNMRSDFKTVVSCSHGFVPSYYSGQLMNVREYNKLHNVGIGYDTSYWEQFYVIDNYTKRYDRLYNLYYMDSDRIADECIAGKTLKTDWAKYSEGKTKIEGSELYAAELFDSFVGPGRTAGYNRLTVKASDEYSLKSVKLNDNWFTASFGVMYGDTEEYNHIHAIETIEWTGDQMDDTAARAFCKRNYMDYSTFGDFKNVADVARAKEDKESVVMVRFAETAYNVSLLRTYDYSKSDNWLTTRTDDGYLARENVFLNLDVIDITFQKDGEYHTIPVVAAPIDHVSGITANPRVPEFVIPWWVWLIVAVVALVILLPLLYFFVPVFKPVIKGIFKAIWWIVSAPFRFIAWVVKKIKNRKKGGNSVE